MSESDYVISQIDKHRFVKSRKNRNLAIGLALGAFIIMIYCVTIFKLGSTLFM